jgi:hypothetical protein
MGYVIHQKQKNPPLHGCMTPNKYAKPLYKFLMGLNITKIPASLLDCCLLFQVDEFLAPAFPCLRLKYERIIPIERQ